MNGCRDGRMEPRLDAEFQRMEFQRPESNRAVLKQA